MLTILIEVLELENEKVSVEVKPIENEKSTRIEKGTGEVLLDQIRAFMMRVPDAK